MNRLASTATTGVLADSFKVKLPGKERQTVFFGRFDDFGMMLDVGGK